ncbi:MAG TPA: hypothetical protein VLX92_18790 [Kofleriaceae bacterium]|nr:hypothetical protein [Kofleriaceae bacterium]
MRAIKLLVLAAALAGCQTYSEQANNDFFVAFGNGLSNAVNSTSSGRQAPDTSYGNASVACSPGEISIVTSVTVNVQTGYVAIQADANTVPAPGGDDKGCVVDGDDITGYLNLTGEGTPSSPPVLMVTGAWSAEGCNCTAELSVSAQSGWNGQVCGASVVNSIISGQPSC